MKMVIGQKSIKVVQLIIARTAKRWCSIAAIIPFVVNRTGGIDVFGLY
tara:strand:+ start:809 stop:952 length:144 start_codon:yes stop_codon:yes gene_type:complete